jgi:hypothetical protein
LLGWKRQIGQEIKLKIKHKKDKLLSENGREERENCSIYLEGQQYGFGE